MNTLAKKKTTDLYLRVMADLSDIAKMRVVVGIFKNVDEYLLHFEIVESYKAEKGEPYYRLVCAAHEWDICPEEPCAEVDFDKEQDLFRYLVHQFGECMIEGSCGVGASFKIFMESFGYEYVTGRVFKKKIT